MAGLYFEQFTVGQVFDHPIRRTITEADNVFFTALTHNPAPLHLDAEYCRETEFGRPLVNSCLTLGFMVGISVGDTTLGTTELPTMNPSVRQLLTSGRPNSVSRQYSASRCSGAGLCVSA
ncbi:MAG TPA: MaoC family dehydratase, partial [Woeseiaceae bacterium]|nr:MaoC family dehydratase [Woeseiaceae bacterium]